MLYSAKMRLPSGESIRESLSAKNLNEAYEKASQLERTSPYQAVLVDVFMVGTKEDKQGFYDAE